MPSTWGSVRYCSLAFASRDANGLSGRPARGSLCSPAERRLLRHLLNATPTPKLDIRFFTNLLRMPRHPFSSSSTSLFSHPSSFPLHRPSATVLSCCRRGEGEGGLSCFFLCRHYQHFGFFYVVVFCHTFLFSSSFFSFLFLFLFLFSPFNFDFSGLMIMEDPGRGDLFKMG